MSSHGCPRSPKGAVFSRIVFTNSPKATCPASALRRNAGYLRHEGLLGVWRIIASTSQRASVNGDAALDLKGVALPESTSVVCRHSEITVARTASMPLVSCPSYAYASQQTAQEIVVACIESQALLTVWIDLGVQLADAQHSLHR